MTIWQWILSLVGGERTRVALQSIEASTHKAISTEVARYPVLPESLRSSPAPVQFVGPIGKLPTTRGGVYDTYGNPGGSAIDKKWERRNMVVARDLPGTWNDSSHRLYIHKLAEPYLREALRLCQERLCIGYIKSMGCFNFRHQRHDATLPLSYHSWGIAIDINSSDNAAKYFTENAPQCFSPEWWKLWRKGIPAAVVEAFESVGWRWGGRWRSRDGRGRVFVDPMHLELIA